MIAALMVFLLALAVVSAAAALVTEAGMRRLGAAGRWPWLVALGSGPLALVAGLPGGAGTVSGSPAVKALLPVLTLPGLAVEPGQWVAGPVVEGVLLGSWVALGVVVAAYLLLAHRRLAVERAGWPAVTLHGRRVYMSRDRGPAAGGAVRPWMVVPTWVRELPEDECRMILLHEEEHLRARDPMLLVAALVLVACVAWNPVAWWCLGRFRLAVELDCDARALRRTVDREVYGASLLAVASRALRPSLALAAFFESPSSLSRRIVAMTAGTTRWTGPGGAVLLLVGAALWLQACGMDNPLQQSAGGGDAGEGPAAVGVAPAPASADPGGPGAAAEASPPLIESRMLEQDPNVTPFTQAPALRNRSEVVAALEREYPPLLKAAGVEGRVDVWAFITAEGEVQDVRINEGSGHQALDDAAIRVAFSFRFDPATDKGEPVAVWVSLTVAFALR